MTKSDLDATEGHAAGVAEAPGACVAQLAEFVDFDAFRASLVGWDTAPFQLQRGAIHIRSHFLHTPDLSLMRLRTNRRTSDTNALEAGVVGFVVVLGRKRFCGLDVLPGSLVVLGPGRDYRCVLEAGWESIEFCVSTRLLGEAGLPWADATVSRLAPEECVFPLPERVVAQVKRWADRVLAPQRAGQVGEGGPLGPDAMPTTEDLREEVAGVVLPWLLRSTRTSPEGRAARDPDRRTRFELADQAIRLGESCGDARTSMTTLAAKLGVSRRTVELAFRDAVGCPPAHYFRTQRLISVRRDLLRGRSVTEAALAEHFVSLGRFSAQYSRQFGERPSETSLRSR